MRLFYGGRAVKDPPLTTIFLLVFVLVCHGVSGDEPGATPADGSTTTVVATTSQAALDCRSIQPTDTTDDIVKKCTKQKALNLNGKWIFLSPFSTKEINTFLENKTTLNRGIHIENRTDLHKLKIGQLTDLGDRLFGGLHIVNTNLENIVYAKTDEGAPDLRIYGELVIRGNKKLDADFISILRGIHTGPIRDIQSYGECFVPLLITDLKDLDDCHYVTGDLSFANWPIGTTSNAIKLITGNVKIVNTDLTRLPFAQTGKIKIDGNFEFKDNIGLCWVNDENYKDYFEVKGKAKVRNTPCPYSTEIPVNKTTTKMKKSKKTTTTPAATEEPTTKNPNTVTAVVPALFVFFMIFM